MSQTHASYYLSTFQYNYSLSLIRGGECFMRKVILTMKAKRRYQVIKAVSDNRSNKHRASIQLDISVRQVNRLLSEYKKHGKSAFIHGNKGKHPMNSLSPEEKKKIIDLYNKKYQETNFTHFTELLEREENVKVSRSTVARLLKTSDIISPKAQRKTRREYNKKLRNQLKKAKKKAERQKIENRIVSLKDAHPSRPRKKYFGELLQMDASLHHWFGEEKTTLHIAIDDCTGRILGAYFDNDETLKGYYNVFHQILLEYGIPYEFITDRRTVFEYEFINKKKLSEDTFTQFSYACHQLGVNIKTSSVPQAKGRVERMFNTFQSRLITELKINGITTIDQANKFLKSYLLSFNEQFGLEMNNIMSVFENKLTPEKANLVLAILDTRKIDSGHHFKFKNEYYAPVDETGAKLLYKKGTEVLIIQAFDGNLFVTIDEKIATVRKLETHERHSKELDPPKKTKKESKKWIPPMDHPWRKASFKQYLRKAGKTEREWELERIQQ